MASFWDDIFGQVQAQHPDQSIGAGLTGEREGLLGDVVGTMWRDPIALGAFDPNVIDWDRDVTNRDLALGQYMPRSDPETPDTIRFLQPGPVGPLSGTGSITGDPRFPQIARHEFGHRGLFNLADDAAANNVPITPLIQPFTRSPALHERLNVFSDRTLGDLDSYAGRMTFGPWEHQLYSTLLQSLRGTADQVNAARVQRMHANPGITWSQTR